MKGDNHRSNHRFLRSNFGICGGPGRRNRSSTGWAFGFRNYFINREVEGSVLWRKFYRDHFSLELPTFGENFFLKPNGFAQFLIVARRLSLERIFGACCRLFPCQKYELDLDRVVFGESSMSGFSGFGDFYRAGVRCFLNEVSSGRSAKVSQSEGLNGLTLRERMLIELKIFLEKGEHSDEWTISICSGSRDLYGDVPMCFFDQGTFRVASCAPIDSSGSFVVHQVVRVP